MIPKKYLHNTTFSDQPSYIAVHSLNYDIYHFLTI